MYELPTHNKYGFHPCAVTARLRSCLQIPTAGDAEELGDFFSLQPPYSSPSALSGWWDLACDKGCLEQDTMKSLLRRCLSSASLSSLCTQPKSATRAAGPRRQPTLPSDTVLWRCAELFLKIRNFIIFLNYRGKVEIITEVLQNSKG